MSLTLRLLLLVLSENLENILDKYIFTPMENLKSLSSGDNYTYAKNNEDKDQNEKTEKSDEEIDENYKHSMKADPLDIKSPKTALELLATAIQLQNMPLVKQCVENLDQNLDKDNVLMIYSFLSKCRTPVVNKNNFEPSAPPIIDNENQMGSTFVEDLIDSLKHNCLLLIDANADYVLKKREILQMSYNDFLNIVDRDTLEVSNELIVYSAIYRWGIEECHRMTLSPHHLKEVLRQLCYVPRYGLMSKKDFCSRSVDGLKGPVRSGILEEKEWRLIKFYIEERSKGRPVTQLEGKMSQSRISGSVKPDILSHRSARKASDSNPTKRKDSGNNCNGKTKCEKFIINFLTCWTAVFD